MKYYRDFDWLRPEILAHSNIPKPLHGTAPRVILGDAWWDKERFEALRRHGYHCYACGNGAKQDKFEKRWLHCHECYGVDYKNTLVTYKETVAL